MIKEVSALKTVPTRVGRFIRRKPDTSVSVMSNGGDHVLKDKLSYIIHAEKTDTVDPFMKEHFDYLRYLGVRD